MSRIGRRPIVLPKGVELTRTEDGVVTVKGPKGTLTRSISPDLTIVIENETAVVQRPTDNKEHRSLHGLSRTLVANMVEGVTTGYTRQLEIQGVGFRAEVQGTLLRLSVGFSHAIEVLPREGVAFAVANAPHSRNPVTTITGIDTERLGQTAAEIRKLRKPEPYKGKGIRYKGEAVRRKQGKASGKGGKKK
ncbi:MAG: 50S ribosomal protein L6 [Armatimonadetes bacterium]|nr:50S ribosomal protein L6 [Armatimonadota bacterium]